MVGEDSEGSVGPRIVRGRVDSVSLYEVTDYELRMLEEGLPGSIYLTFAVFFLSVSLSFLTTLLTSPPTSTRTFTVFVVVSVVGAAIGVVLLVLWYRMRKRVSKIIQKIKDRCFPEAARPDPLEGPNGEPRTSNQSSPA